LRIGVGFADIKNFHLDLKDKFRSWEFQEKKAAGEQISSEIVKDAMKLKILDEKNSKPYRRFMKKLRTEAAKLKKEAKENYEEKLEHLRTKYRKSKEDLSKTIPEGFEEYKTLTIFDPGKFSDIEPELMKLT
jgi:hypothetical protein